MASSRFETSHLSGADYCVPRQFSLTEFLALTTVFGLLFGGLRWFAAPVVLSLFLGGQGILVCLVQILVGREPRLASTVVGALSLPVWECLICPVTGLPSLLTIDGIWERVLCATVLGGLLGYCTGTLAAGVFLVSDRWDRLCLRPHEDIPES